MRIASLCRLIPLLLYSAKLSSAYFIHESCTEEVYGGKVVKAIQTAIQWAADADTQWDDNDDVDIKNLKKWVFGKDPNKLATARSFFTNIRALTQTNVETDDLWFLCTSEYQFVATDDSPDNPSGVITINTLMGGPFAPGDGNKLCDKNQDNPAMAYTGVSRFRRSSYILFCDWYLDLLKGDDIMSTEVLLEKLDGDGDKGALTAQRNPNDFPSPMDYFAMFETTALHELTHTHKAGGSADVDGVDSYGWANVRRLAATNGYMNADSLAFFGLGVRLINEGYQLK
ncbi:hypothetical protein F5Y05DRAFT_424558 [Hypoxylon sp. FL0543]|nr:hypothetical protein F5Y05DRAFT_424558 [Hypoxylon sp. FL0543]